jgi:hypothetical protein
MPFDQAVPMQDGVDGALGGDADVAAQSADEQLANLACTPVWQTSLIDSPSSKRATNRRRSSITEHSFHGIDTSPVSRESVTYVSGTF